MVSRKSGGFYIIEMLVVILLITLFASMTFINSSLLTKQQIKGQLHELHAAIMYLHRYALTTGKPQALIFDTTKNTYTIDNTTYTLPADVIFGFTSLAMGPPSNPVHAITQAITFVNNQIIAYPDGTIQSGTIYVTNAKKQIMYALTIPVGHVSYIRLYQWDTTWKKI